MILSEQKGVKVYSDTEELENEMLGIASQYPEDSSEEYIANDARYTVNNTFSSVRRNLLNWYNFSEDACVLEVGAGMGALTGLLCDKCKHVTAIEMSPRRAEVIKKRYPQRDNLKIICENIFEWESEEKFDYAVVVGVLEYAAIFAQEEDRPYEKFLTAVKRQLKPNGILLIAIENRFGLKYWSGASEDHLCVPFAGIDGYKAPNTAQTFSKNRLEKMLDEVGLKWQRFFYVLPDYKFPTMIYTDEYKPNASAIQKLALSYVKGSTLVFDERGLYKEIIDNNVQDFFANSFLIEASMCENEIEQPIYVAAKGEIKKKYRVSTLIYSDRVEKVAAHNDAKQHLDNILENENQLLSRDVLVWKSKRDNNKLITPLFHEETAESLFHRYLENNNETMIREMIEELKRNLLKSSETSTCSVMDELIGAGKDYGPVLKNAFIDMTFSNAFVSGNEYVFFDQEWLFQNIPMKFIVFYAVRQSYLSFFGRTKITLEKLYKIAEVYDDIDDYVCLERKIWNDILYRQEHFYDQDGWYNHYYKFLKVDRFLTKEELDEKNAYIESLEESVREKTERILKLEHLISVE